MAVAVTSLPIHTFDRCVSRGNSNYATRFGTANLHASAYRSRPETVDRVSSKISSQIATARVGSIFAPQSARRLQNESETMFERETKLHFRKLQSMETAAIPDSSETTAGSPTVRTSRVAPLQIVARKISQ